MNYRSIVAVALDPSLMKQEHRYSGLVERFKPDLLDLKHLRIKWYFVLMIECVLEGFEIHAIDGSGHQERGKRNQQIFRLWLRA